MGMIGNTPYQGIIQEGNIQDGAITAAKIKAAADLLTKLGYTPVNKAGDTITGDLNLGSILRKTDSINNVGWYINTATGRAYMVLDGDSLDGVGSGTDYLYLGSDYVNVLNELTVYTTNDGTFFQSNNQNTRVIGKPLRAVHSVGGEWAILGSVSGGTGNYIHVKTTLAANSNRMCGFRLSGYYPYSKYGSGFLGCYTYMPTDPVPYGPIIHNAGNQAVADGMYYSSDGYLVLRLYWPTDYCGVLIEHLANGSNYGDVNGVKIAAYTKSNSTTGVY